MPTVARVCAQPAASISKQRGVAPAAFSTAVQASKLGKLMLAGLKSPRLVASEVSTFKVDGRPRANAKLTLTAKLPDGKTFTAQLTANFSLSGGKPVLAYVPKVTTVQVPPSGLADGARFLARMQRLGSHQYQRGDLAACVDPKKYEVTVKPRPSGGTTVATVVYSTAGFAGPGSKFKESYDVVGSKRGGALELTAGSYHNWLEGSDGYPIE